jgi:transposase
LNRSNKGEAISQERKSRKELSRLLSLIKGARQQGDLKTWRRASAVMGYIKGKSVIDMSTHFGVTRGSINRWLQWFEAEGTQGLRARKPVGRPPLLQEEQLLEIVQMLEAGPQEAGYTAGIWTGPMIGDWIHRTYGVRYHQQHIPRLLHQLGFSMQRPRKRLARADAEKQRVWLQEKLPMIKKRLQPVGV